MTLFSIAGAKYWIAEENGVIIGGCGVYPTPGLPEGCAELVKFYLAAMYRGKGVGWQLMEKTFTIYARELGYKQLYLESLPDFREGHKYCMKGPDLKEYPPTLENSGHFGCDIWMLKDLT